MNCAILCVFFVWKSDSVISFCQISCLEESLKPKITGSGELKVLRSTRGSDSSIEYDRIWTCRHDGPGLRWYCTGDKMPTIQSTTYQHIFDADQEVLKPSLKQAISFCKTDSSTDKDSFRQVQSHHHTVTQKHIILQANPTVCCSGYLQRKWQGIMWLGTSLLL